jgi:hypothetical protein
MIQGMMWFDNSGAELSQKIDKAAAYYQNKYGHTPNSCRVHPRMTDADHDCGSIRVERDPSIRINHLWLGQFHK